jgi:hypothetical protein
VSLTGGEMKIRRHIANVVTAVVVVSIPLIAMSGVATAKAAKGCHKTHSCSVGGGSPTGSGTGASGSPITVQIDPNPLVETGQSDVAATIQVETSPSFAGDPVEISSSQLSASCQTGVEYLTEFGSANAISVTLDDDGNATVFVEGDLCAPGADVVEADLEEAPYDTALGTLTVDPPVVTASGVFGYPTTSGTVTTGEVETGETNLGVDGSDVYAVFYVETSPVYAEQAVELSSDELESRCGGGWNLNSFTADVDSPTGAIGVPVTASLDDDGNAVFMFTGTSCAAGPSEVVADVLAGSHPTYTTTFNINPPQPTI